MSLSVSVTLDEPGPAPETAEKVYRRKIGSLRGAFHSADLNDWNTRRAWFDIVVAIEVQDWKSNSNVVSEARDRAKSKLDGYLGDWHVADDGEVLERLAF